MRRDSRSPDRRPTPDKFKLVDRPWIKPDGCKTDADCGPNPMARYCNTATGQCVACKANADCSSYPTTPVCNTATGQCVACKVDANCASDSTARYCNSATGQCVACRVDADCASLTAKFCSYMTGECVECKANADCTAATPWKPLCDTTIGTCVECYANTDCVQNPKGHVCDATTHACRCSVDADCPSVICDVAAGRCGCKADTDCGPATTTPFCNWTANICVQCRTDADCAAGLPPGLRGNRCDVSVPHHSCSCLVDAHCSPTYSMGPKCDVTSGACHCVVSSECVGNALGQVCAPMGSCSCVQDTDCLGGKKCTGLNPWSLGTGSVKMCQ